MSQDQIIKNIRQFLSMAYPEFERGYVQLCDPVLWDAVPDTFDEVNKRYYLNDEDAEVFGMRVQHDGFTDSHFFFYEKSRV